MRLPPDEWLHHAKRLAVGRKRRVRHNEERDCAMDVWNNGDSYSAWCHRCHLSGWVPKQHQQLNVQRVDPDRIGPVPADCLHITQASGYEQSRIWKLLTEKGCPPGVLPEEHLWFSRSTNRILLRQGLQGLGRALSPLQQPKWLAFGDWWNKPRLWWTRYRDAGPMVLAEDVLSSYKVAKAIEVYAPESSVSVAAVLGTVLTSTSLPLIAGRDVVCMFDGDAAGAEGSAALKRRLAVFGGTFRDARPAHGDPKNMTLEEIQWKLSCRKQT